MGIFGSIGGALGGAGGFFLGGPGGASLGASLGGGLGSLFDKNKSGGGGGGTSGPSISPAAAAFQQDLFKNLSSLMAIADETRAEGRLLSPALFEALGLDAQFDAEGNLSGISGVAEGSARAKTVEAGGLSADRLLRALRGEFVSPALEKRLKTGLEDRERKLRRQLGPGFDLSTVGIQSLEEGRGSDEITRFLSEQAEIESGTKRAGQFSDLDQRFIENLTKTVPGRRSFEADTRSNLATASRGPLAFLLGQQQIGAERDIFQKQLKESRAGGLFDLAGTIFGAPTKGGGSLGGDALKKILGSILGGAGGGGGGGSIIPGSGGTGLQVTQLPAPRR